MFWSKNGFSTFRKHCKIQCFLKILIKMAFKKCSKTELKKIPKSQYFDECFTKSMTWIFFISLISNVFFTYGFLLSPTEKRRLQGLRLSLFFACLGLCASTLKSQILMVISSEKKAPERDVETEQQGR